jgi:hypothetical protein
MHITRRILIAIGIGLSVRIAVVELMHRRFQVRLPDSELYERYAETVYDGRAYEVDGDRARRSPGYPIFIAVCWRLAGAKHSDRAVFWCQAICGTLTCVVVYWLAQALEPQGLPPGAAAATLALTLLDPYAVVLAAFELSETLFTFLIVLAVLLAKDVRSRLSMPRALAAGVVAGVAILVRPSGMLLAPVAAVMWWLAVRRTVGSVPIFVACLGFVAAVAPWWVRNARTFGTFVPATLNVGESLYDGLGPQARGGSDMRFLDEARRRPEYRAMSEVDRNRFWWNQTIDTLRDDPTRVARLALVKFFRFWSPWPNEPQFRRAAVVAVTLIGTVPVWVLAAWGAWYLRQHSALLALGLAPPAYFCILHLLFVSSVRYRVPGSPFLAILAGAMIAALFGRVTK